MFSLYVSNALNLFMPIQFTIKITKEILELSKECGTNGEVDTIGKDCAIAVSLKDMFRDVFVTGDYIYPFGIDENNNVDELKIEMPKVAKDFVRVFDSLRAIPKVRLCLPEFEFELPISDEVISQINIDEVRAIAFRPCLQR